MPINTLDCSSDGKWIVSGSQDELIKVSFGFSKITYFLNGKDMGSEHLEANL